MGTRKRPGLYTSQHFLFENIILHTYKHDKMYLLVNTVKSCPLKFYKALSRFKKKEKILIDINKTF